MRKLQGALLVLLFITVTLASSSFESVGFKRMNTVRQKLANLTGIKFPRLIEDPALVREARTMRRPNCEDIRAPPNKRFYLSSFSYDKPDIGKDWHNVFQYGLYLALGLTPEEARIPKDLLAVSQFAKSYLEPKMSETGFMMGSLEAYNPEQVAAGCSPLGVRGSIGCNQTVPPEFGLGLNQHFTANSICLFGDSGTFKDAKKVLKLVRRAYAEAFGKEG